MLEYHIRYGVESVSRFWRWAEHVTRMREMRSAYKILVGNSERKRPLGRHSRRWEDNIKMGIREIGFGLRIQFIWLRIGLVGLLWTRYLKFGFHKKRGISWLASQEVLCSMELASYCSATKVLTNCTFCHSWLRLPQKLINGIPWNFISVANLNSIRLLRWQVDWFGCY
jgi:hypothetical protein